jgi:uncharacterized repeat protein (TIGR03803 family)
MQSQAQPLISLVRTIVRVVVAALLITLAALPVSAQNAVPPTAVQAAKTPEFASRLAHRTSRPASLPNPQFARQGSHRGPLQGGVIYENGPINGNTDAWTINFGFVVSDTFTAVNPTSITGMSFGAWLFPGDTLTSAELSITSSPNGGMSYFDQTVNFTQTGCTADQYGYNVCTVSTTFNGPGLNAGTYWVNLQNASVPSGNPVYWDENSGVGCQSSGCPSEASLNTVGSIPSESFTMVGGNPPPPPCFESQGKLQIIYDFTQQQAGLNSQAGVTIDKAGNLYGVTGNGGNNGAGFAFKLARLAGWLLDPLFNFVGGDNGGEPTGVIVSPNGSLYGGAQGGIQSCSNGSQYCGLVFNLTPGPTACLTALCSWTENVPYRFMGDSDGSGSINVSAFDHDGNLYGTSSSGGAYGEGTVFELTPSGQGWTKTILYSFTGGNDGYAPTQVLVGNDGNLYGVAGGGVYTDGVVFQLTPSGGHWTQSVLHAFQYAGEGSGPHYLVQDGAGNLYGITLWFDVGPIFVLEKTSSGWVFSEYFVQHGGSYEYLNNLAIDASGNLYGTGAGGEGCSRGRCNTSPDSPSYYSYIFKAWYASDGWHYEDLDYLGYQSFPAVGSLAIDPSGNLYGTTFQCGTNNFGTVWQLSP